MKKFIMIILILASSKTLISQSYEWRLVDEITDDTLTTHLVRDIKCADSQNCIQWLDIGLTPGYYYFRKTTDGGKIWENVYQSEYHPAELRAIAYPSPDLFIAVGEDTVLLRTTDRGESWEKIPFDKTRYIGKIKMYDDKYGIALATDRIDTTFFIERYMTKDGGITWERMIPPKGYSWLDSAFVDDYQFLDSNMHVELIRVWANKDGGTLNSLLLWVEGNFDSWHIDSVNNPTDYRLRDMCFIDKNTGWLGYADVKGGKIRQLIIKTTDGGKNWDVKRDSLFYGCPVIDFQFADENFGVGTTCLETVLITHDGGDTWDTTRIANSPGNPNLQEVQAPATNIAYVVGAARKVYKYANWETDVVEPEAPITDISLYPNPAGDRLTVRGPGAGVGERQEIVIYNVLGEVVVNYELRMTNYEFKRDIDVSGLAPGMYFVRIGKWRGRFVKY